MKVLVFGSNGQLGTDVVGAVRERGDTCYPACHSEADVTDHERLRSLVLRERPDAIINCTAYHDLRLCEEHPEEATKVNALAVRYMAEACTELHIRLMTVSTDYVFDGTKIEGYSEDDCPNPQTWYGRSKLAGEWLAAASCPKTFIVRSQSLYGLNAPRGKGPNFVDSMIRLASERKCLEVDQFRMSPTWTRPLARNMVALLHTQFYGLCHMSCQGATTWHEFAKRILELTGSSTRVIPVPNDTSSAPFARPENTYLVNARLKSLGLDFMPAWQTSLSEFLAMRPVPPKNDERPQS